MDAVDARSQQRIRRRCRGDCQGCLHVRRMGKQVLLKAGADVNAEDRDGWTSLMLAADGERVGVVEVTAKAVCRSCIDRWTNRFC